MGEKQNSFTKHYRVFYLVWFETTKYVLNAINMEKQIKKYTTAQKEALIIHQNPGWCFLNETILGNWPPNAEQIALAKARKGSS
jgi:predicted GIY-YIG superfamily endonuclease